MEIINNLIDNQNIPVLSAFLLGILVSLSPCPLATNITAIAYISKGIKSAKNTLFKGIAYTLGRGLAYTILAMLVYSGFSSFKVAAIFQGWGDKVLGLVLIMIGLVMFDIIKINSGTGNVKIERFKEWLAGKGYSGAFLLGVIFSLAFCPYSGVLFFGALMPLVIRSAEGLFLPFMFALGTGLPVIVFSILLAFSVERVGKMFNAMQRIEKIMRYGIASVFILSGAYYLQFLVKYLFTL